MIVETAYPWTTALSDEYTDEFGSETPLAGYPFSPKGQFDMMVKLAGEIREGGGVGLIYWEAAWISSETKDHWGTGSSWENCALFLIL